MIIQQLAFVTRFLHDLVQHFIRVLFAAWVELQFNAPRVNPMVNMIDKTGLLFCGEETDAGQVEPMVPVEVPQEQVDDIRLVDHQK